MRFLIPLLLMCSLAGYSQAQERRTQLPYKTYEIQVRGQTYYQHGDTYYRFYPAGGYYYEVSPPTYIPRSDRAHYYRRDMSQQGLNLSESVERGCRNQAADLANKHPASGGRVYLHEYSRCINMAARQ